MTVLCETEITILFLFLGKPDTITFDDKSSFTDRCSSFALVLHSFRCYLVFHYNNFARDDITKNFVQRSFSRKKGSCFMSRTITIILIILVLVFFVKIASSFKFVAKDFVEDKQRSAHLQHKKRLLHKNPQ